ncbi:hypothetical protein HF521_010231, partial [Silurus meridionalis]
SHCPNPPLRSSPSVLPVGYRERPADTRQTEAGAHSASSPMQKWRQKTDGSSRREMRDGRGREGRREKQREGQRQPAPEHGKKWNSFYTHPDALPVKRSSLRSGSLHTDGVHVKGSPQRIIHIYTPLSSTSDSFNPTTCMSSLTTFIYLLFGLSFLLLPGGAILSILLPIYPMSLLCTCPNHLNRASLTLSPKPTTCTVPLISSFLILSILDTPNENLNIFSSATSSSTSCLLLNATVSKPYIITGLTTVL